MAKGKYATVKIAIFYSLVFVLAFSLAMLIPAVGHEKSFLLMLTVFPIGFLGLLAPQSTALIYLAIMLRILPIISVGAYIGYALYAVIGVRSNKLCHLIGFITFLVLDLIGLIIICISKGPFRV